MRFKNILILSAISFWWVPALLTKKIHISSWRKFCDNFHTVESNALYRSKQLSPHYLRKYIIRNNIKTIVNLRGVNKASQWWQQERNVALAHGIHFYNISMSANSLSSKKNLIKLLHIYKNAPKPILIHCKSGVDRTGEAAALWIIEQQRLHKRKAFKHLSFKYWYIQSRRPAKHFLIKIWQDRNWLLSSYNPTDYPAFYSQRA